MRSLLARCALLLLTAACAPGQVSFVPQGNFPGGNFPAGNIPVLAGFYRGDGLVIAPPNYFQASLSPTDELRLGSMPSFAPAAAVHFATSIFSPPDVTSTMVVADANANAFGEYGNVYVSVKNTSDAPITVGPARTEWRIQLPYPVVGGAFGDLGVRLMNLSTPDEAPFDFTFDLQGNLVVRPIVDIPLNPGEALAVKAILNSIVRHDPANAEADVPTLVWELDFGQPVKGVDKSLFALDGPVSGTLSVEAVQDSNDSRYHITASGLTLAEGVTSGEVRVNLLATEAITALQNPSRHFGLHGYTGGQPYVLTQPDLTPEITSKLTSPTNASTIPVTVTFPLAVTGFDASDVTITGGTLAHFGGEDAVYTFDVTPTVEGTVTVTIPAGAATEARGWSTPSGQFTIEHDTVAPAVEAAKRLLPESEPVTGDSITFTVFFEEAVTGVDAADFVLTGHGVTGTIESVTKRKSGIYEILVTNVSGKGTLRLDLASSGTHIVDLAGNPILVGYTGGPSVTVDNLPEPEVTQQSITFAALADRAANAGPLTLSASASSGLPVAFTLVSGPATLAGDTLTLTGKTGTVVVSATQAGNDAFAPAAAVTRSFTVTKAAQTLTFAAPADRRANDAPFALVASASSGLPVTFTVVSGPAILDGATVTLTGAAGLVTLRAEQAGNDTFAAASEVVRSFQVIEAGPLVYFGTLGNEEIAAHLQPDGRSGTMIGMLPGTEEGFVVNFTVDAQGRWSATVTTIAGIRTDVAAVRAPDAPITFGSAPAAVRPVTGSTAEGVSRTFHGQIVGNVLTGTIEGLDLEFSAELQPATGATAGLAGYYEAPSINSASGATYSVVGTRGRVYVLVITANTVAGSGGTVDTDGQFTVRTPQDVTVVGAVNPVSTSVTGTIILPDDTVEDFSGVRESTQRTDRLINLSTRTRVTPGATAFTGFVIGGTAPKTVLVRGIGPSLGLVGMTGGAADPLLRVFNADRQPVAQNDNWGGTAELAAAMTRSGAFAIPANSRDAALLLTLAPGVYTIQVTAPGSGIVLAEVYDAAANPSGEYQRLVNISSRGIAAPGEGTLIGGFIITGNSPKRVLVRAAGPALTAHGSTNPLADPELRVFGADQQLVARNQDWETPVTVNAQQASATATEITAAARTVGAFPFAAGSKDAALIVTLAPGAYTAHASTSAASGDALIEVYELAP